MKEISVLTEDHYEVLTKRIEFLSEKMRAAEQRLTELESERSAPPESPALRLERCAFCGADVKHGVEPRRVLRITKWQHDVKQRDFGLPVAWEEGLCCNGESCRGESAYSQAKITEGQAIRAGRTGIPQKGEKYTFIDANPPDPKILIGLDCAEEKINTTTAQTGSREAGLLSVCTDRVRKTLQLANQEAQRSNRLTVDTPHVLLALLKEGHGVAAAAMIRLSCAERHLTDSGLVIDYHRMRDAVLEILPEGPADFPRSGGKLPGETAVREALETAWATAHKMGHHYIGTEHLLIALALSDWRCSLVLAKLGVGRVRLAREVYDLLGVGPEWVGASTPGLTIFDADGKKVSNTLGGRLNMEGDKTKRTSAGKLTVFDEDGKVEAGETPLQWYTAKMEYDGNEPIKDACGNVVGVSHSFTVLPDSVSDACLPTPVELADNKPVLKIASDDRCPICGRDHLPGPCSKY